MRHTFFEIQNFKGIEHVRLDFNAQPKSNVYTLIGLNESGKTTILEAINLLNYRTDLDPLNLPGYSTKDVHDLIPIAKRSNFNGRISITAGFELNQDDEEAIRKYVLSLDFELEKQIGSFYVTQSYEFKNSKLIQQPSQPRSTWTLPLVGKVKRGRKTINLTGEKWLKTVNFVKGWLPDVLYFPNFLFEFPDKIYLEEAPSDAKKHEFYRAILQDVLDAIGEETNLAEHVLARAKSVNRFDKKSLESVLLKMSGNISATVFRAWDQIFKRTSGNKEIVVDIDQDENERWFLQLRLKEGSDLYSISERSLGFRWFFAFLLLTQYRGYRLGTPKHSLFLFDEPASNLHPSAQSQLLDSFGRFPGNSVIVYTTHSHHMINPDWLEGAYVVKNEGLSYDGGEDDYTARQTVVVLQKYRQFAVQHPQQTTYFQPVLDVLNYSPGRLENIPSVVMLEGKNDFYTLKFFQQLLQTGAELNLMPGSGAGSLTDIIRLYLAWGRNFIVLLDADTAGHDQKQRYNELFGALVAERIFTLSDINADWAKRGMEYLIPEADRLALQKLSYPSEPKLKKSLLNRAVQELFLKRDKPKISDETRANFLRLLRFCETSLHAQSEAVD